MADKYIEALLKSWKFAQSDVYQAGEQEKQDFAKDIHLSCIDDPAAPDLKAPETDYDKALKAEMGTLFGGESDRGGGSESGNDQAAHPMDLGGKSKSLALPDFDTQEGDNEELGSNTDDASESPLAKLLGGFEKPEQKDPVDISEVDSPAAAQMALVQGHLKKLDEVSAIHPVCPDEKMAQNITSDATAGLDQVQLTKLYDGALEESIDGHSIEKQMPQADALMKAHQSFISGMSSLMPFARSNPELSKQVLKSQKTFEKLGEHLKGLEKTWKEDKKDPSAVSAMKEFGANQGGLEKRNSSEMLPGVHGDLSENGDLKSKNSPNNPKDMLAILGLSGTDSSDGSEVGDILSTDDKKLLGLGVPSGTSKVVIDTQDTPQLSAKMSPVLSASGVKDLGQNLNGNQIASEISESGSQTASHAKETKALVNELQNSMAKSAEVVTAEGILDKVATLESGVFFAKLDLTQVQHGLSIIQNGGSVPKGIPEGDIDLDLSSISLKGLESRSANSLSVVQNIHDQYQAASQGPEALAHKPMDALHNRLQAHQLDEDSLNQKMMSHLLKANSSMNKLSAVKNCKEMKDSSSQAAMKNMNKHLDSFGDKLQTVKSIDPEAMSASTGEASQKLTVLSQTMGAQLTRLDQGMGSANTELTQAAGKYQESLDKLNSMQGNLQSRSVKGALNSKQEQALQAQLAEAEAKYKALQNAYEKKLAALEAMAKKMQSAISAQLESAQTAVNKVAGGVSKNMCSASLADACKVPNTLADTTSLSQVGLHALGGMTKAAGLNKALASAMRSQELEVSEASGLLAKIEQQSQKTKQLAQGVLDDVDHKVSQSLDKTAPLLENLMSQGVEAMVNQLVPLVNKLKAVQEKIPACPYCDEEVEDLKEKAQQHLDALNKMKEVPKGIQAQGDQLLALRDQTIALQALANSLAGNTKGFADNVLGQVQSSASGLSDFPSSPSDVMAMLQFTPPSLPNLPSLTALPVQIPELTDMANKATGALACAAGSSSGGGGSAAGGGAALVATSSNAQVKCVLGGPPMPILVLPFGVNLAPGKPATLPINIIPMLNVKPFAPCTNPVNPLVIASLGAPSACMPLVRKPSQLHCAYTAMTGLGTIQQAGQENIKVK